MIRAIDRVTLNWRNVSVEKHRRVIQAIKEGNFEQAKLYLESGIIRARDEIIHNVETRKVSRS